MLTGFKAIKEALVTKSADFSGRPRNLLASDITEKKGDVYLYNYTFTGYQTWTKQTALLLNS